MSEIKIETQKSEECKQEILKNIDFNLFNKMIEESADNKINKQIIIMDELKEKFPELFNEDGGMDWKFFEENIRPNYNIFVRKDKKSISFTLNENFTIKDAEYFIVSFIGYALDKKM